jgi:hypothetical protein
LSFQQAENPAARTVFKKELKVHVVVFWRMWMEMKCRILFIFAFLLLSSPPILHGGGGCYGFTLHQEQSVKNLMGGKCPFSRFMIH